MNASTKRRRVETFLEVAQAMCEIWFPLNPTRTSIHFVIWSMVIFELYEYLCKGTYQVLHRRRVEWKRSAELLQTM